MNTKTATATEPVDSRAYRAITLPVVNDGRSYPERARLALRHVGDHGTGQHAAALRPIVADYVRYARERWGETFPAAVIKTALAQIAEHDRDEILDTLQGVARGGAEIIVSGKRWFGTANGNTYHTCTIKIGPHTLSLPLTYGYGDQWMWTAADWLLEMKIVDNPSRDGQRPAPWDLPITFGNVADVERKAYLV